MGQVARSLRSVLQAVRAHAAALPEPYCDCFRVDPPVAARWPDGLPSHPLLDEFYSACDGCDCWVCSFLPVGELAEVTAETAEWMESTGAGDLLPAGRWLVLGYNQFDHRLIWDAGRDAVFVYDTDGGDLFDADDAELAYDGSGPATTGGVTLARFFEGLLNPSPDAQDEATREWARAIEHCERRESP